MNRPHRHDPGPGFGSFPRHGVLRVNDLVPPGVDPAVVYAALAARGVPVGDRDVPVGTSVRALVAPTPAGTLVTLERRGGLRAPRPVVLRRLARLWEDLAHDVRNRTESRDETGQTGAQGLDLAE